jgi:hypothetical protein
MEDSGKRGLCSACEILDVLPDKLSDRKSLCGIPFVDMKRMDEVDRIKQIVQMLRESPGKILLVMVDCGGEYDGKGDRWLAAIRESLPDVKVVRRSINTPIPDVESIHLRL